MIGPGKAARGSPSLHIHHDQERPSCIPDCHEGEHHSTLLGANCCESYATRGLSWRPLGPVPFTIKPLLKRVMMRFHATSTKGPKRAEAMAHGRAKSARHLRSKIDCNYQI
eukprot:5117045-Amphidinium_carterae.1